MNKLILPFLNPKGFVCGDKPKVWRKALDNPTQYVNWDTVHTVLTIHGIIEPRSSIWRVVD